MKRRFQRFLCFGATVCSLAGCKPQEQKSEVLAEGVIWSVEYKLEGGGTGGFTRMNEARGVPGGNGSWNVDAYGRLTREYLFITKPGRKDLGPRLIPANRLVEIQFGDGGIKTVGEPNHPK